MCLPISLTTEEVCNANSRVGTRMSPWIAFFVVLHFSRIGITKAPVFSGAVFGSGKNGLACQSNWQAFLLNGRGLLVAHFEDAHQQLPLQEVIFKLIAFSGGNILRLVALVWGRAANLSFHNLLSQRPPSSQAAAEQDAEEETPYSPQFMSHHENDAETPLGNVSQLEFRRVAPICG